MQKKILFTATVDGHIKTFHTPYLKFFKDRGWEVHVAAKGNLNIPYCDKKFEVTFERSPFCVKNIKAYLKLEEIIEGNEYNIIHCHTPVGGVLTRLAARKSRKKGTKVIYTAHGFHFYKGAPTKNWILFYPIEKWFSRYTDCLITINREDYETAREHRFSANKIEYVHGVGVNLENFKPATQKEKNDLRSSYGYNSDQFILFYAAELNRNKNQGLLIKIISELKDKIPKIKLLLAGGGSLIQNYRNMARQLKVNNYVDFLGSRSDVPNLLSMCDIVVASSKREGLPVNIMEAMASAKPIVATDIRGHRDLIKNGKNGFLFNLDDIDQAVNYILKLYTSSKLQKQMGQIGCKQVKTYSLDDVMKEMAKIYEFFM